MANTMDDKSVKKVNDKKVENTGAVTKKTAKVEKQAEPAKVQTRKRRSQSNSTVGGAKTQANSSNAKATTTAKTTATSAKSTTTGQASRATTGGATEKVVPKQTPVAGNVSGNKGPAKNNANEAPKKRSKGEGDSLVKDKKTGKKQSGVVKTGFRTLMITLMVAYAGAVLVIGGWFFVNFFQFYLTEKSPVMGLDTENSRVKDVEIFDAATIEKGKAAILAGGLYIEDVEIRQVGPSVHFLIYIPEVDDIGAGREKANQAISTFAAAIERPDMYATHEAQIIVTKKNLPAVDEATLLRPATDEGTEQQFPQFGVMNHKSDGIKWGNNG